MNKRWGIYVTLLLAYWSTVLALAWVAKSMDGLLGAIAFLGVIALTLPLGLILVSLYVHGAESDFYVMAITFALINSCVIGSLIVWRRIVRQRSNSDLFK